ncbi:PREDICTED: uncharacterized protein LOC109191782 [Ipomoea nil]|uniref:uncharacterized protein LOC109191782 n=1 Tax=Ipomoea nil TaxID=35883 RepID=UPI0009013D2B|nr:PREDICTED: uncharacterized protein LOC109191782 [Ipomoea nil]
MAPRRAALASLMESLRNRDGEDPKRRKTGESSHAASDARGPPRVSRRREVRSTSDVDHASDGPPADSTLRVSMPAAPPRDGATDWTIHFPASASLLDGDVPPEALLRCLVQPRDMARHEDHAVFRPLLETVVHTMTLERAMGNVREQLATEMRARQVVSDRLAALEDQHTALIDSRLRERNAHQLALKEAARVAVSAYKDSQAFIQDIQAYISAHPQETLTHLTSFPAGNECVGRHGMELYEAGESTMQGKIYAALRARDPSFDPAAWGLPEEFEEEPDELGDPMDTAVGADGERPPLDSVADRTSSADFGAELLRFAGVDAAEEETQAALGDDDGTREATQP